METIREIPGQYQHMKNEYAEMTEHLKNEMMLMERLQHIPNIVGMEDYAVIEAEDGIGGGTMGRRGEIAIAGQKDADAIHAQIGELENMARELFGTRVRLDGTTESGRITLFYYNADDLQRIWDVMEMAKEK